MRDFDVKTAELNAAIAANERLVFRMIRYMGEVDQIRSNLRMQIATSTQIGSRLSSYVNALNIEGRQFESFNTAGQTAKNNYVQSERKILLRHFCDNMGIDLPQGVINALNMADISGILTVVDKIKNAKDMIFGEGEIILDGVPIKYDNSGDAPKFTMDYADYVKHQAELDGRELNGWEKFWVDGYKGDYISGEKSVSGEILGFDTGASVKGSLLSYDTGGSATAKMDLENGNVGAKAEAKGEFHAAEGSAEAHFGDLASVKAKGSVGNVAANGEIEATIFTDGHIDPRIAASIAASASVASGSVSAKVGNDVIGGHVDASGEVLAAHADASAAIGKITYKDKDGNEVTGYGVKAQAGAEAYLAKGEISGGFNFFGYNIDFSLEGKAGGAGAKAGFTAATGAISGEIGAGLGLGIGLKFNITKSAETY